MEVTELMVDDWVEVIQNSEKHYAQVQMIDGYGDNATSNECICDGVYYSIDEINPIPLTQQILEKNGFRNSLDEWYLFKGCLQTNFTLKSYDDTNEILLPLFNGDMQITYVHELQHALKLCRIDKNIEL